MVAASMLLLIAAALLAFFRALDNAQLELISLCVASLVTLGGALLAPAKEEADF